MSFMMREEKPYVAGKITGCDVGSFFLLHACFLSQNSLLGWRDLDFQKVAKVNCDS